MQRPAEQFVRVLRVAAVEEISQIAKIGLEEHIARRQVQRIVRVTKNVFEE